MFMNVILLYDKSFYISTASVKDSTNFSCSSLISCLISYFLANLETWDWSTLDCFATFVWLSPTNCSQLRRNWQEPTGITRIKRKVIIHCKKKQYLHNKHKLRQLRINVKKPTTHILRLHQSISFVVIVFVRQPQIFYHL